ncbi:MAG: hypothetical protein ACYDCQ_16030, partial [Dehalococcoidia bacterium]
SVPSRARPALAHAAREGFLSGLNEVLLLGSILAFAGAAAAALLVREREIEREAPAGALETGVAVAGAA